MKNKQKIFLFIDGSNLYSSQYELFGPDYYLDFSLFIKSLTNSLKESFARIYFYASYSPKSKSPTAKEKNYLKNEALFYQSVKKTKNVIFFKGYRSKASGKEKEVDVKLAVDMVDFAHRNKFDKVYLLSGDADFMQALHTVKSLRLPTAVISMKNKIMFKALLFYKTHVVRFDKKDVRLRKIKKKPEYITLEKMSVIKRI